MNSKIIGILQSLLKIKKPFFEVQSLMLKPIGKSDLLSCLEAIYKVMKLQLWNLD